MLVLLRGTFDESVFPPGIFVLPEVVIRPLVPIFSRLRISSFIKNLVRKTRVGFLS